jgi:deoxycytidine triphosphate deaminase
MIYSDIGIKRLIAEGKIKITPETEIKKALAEIHFSESITLKPKEFLTTLTKEKIEISNDIAALYDGYTHLARKGIITHLGSMFIYPGTNNQITLEVFNASDQEIVINKDDRAGQIIFFDTKG